jgi:hypothetical protein
MEQPQSNWILAFSVAIGSFVYKGTAEPLQNPANHLPYEVSKITIVRDKPASWQECVDAAEIARSSRDLEFFISTSKLINAKPWFVSHSRSSEELFCQDVFRCDDLFEGRYAETNGAYAGCE